MHIKSPLPYSAARCLFCIIAVLSGPCRGLVLADELPLGHRFYFNASGGAAFIADTTLQSTDPFLLSGRVRFTPGGRVDFGFGYHITDWLATEIEAGMAFNLTDTVGNSGSDGEGLIFYQVPILASLVCHVPTDSDFHPFFGAGIGGVETHLEDSTWISSRSDHDFGLAWQAFGGARYQLSHHTALGAVYKYLGATARSFPAFNSRMEGTATHSVSISFSLKF